MAKTGKADGSCNFPELHLCHGWLAKVTRRSRVCGFPAVKLEGNNLGVRESLPTLHSETTLSLPKFLSMPLTRNASFWVFLGRGWECKHIACVLSSASSSLCAKHDVKCSHCLTVVTKAIYGNHPTSHVKTLQHGNRGTCPYSATELAWSSNLNPSSLWGIFLTLCPEGGYVCLFSSWFQFSHLVLLLWAMTAQNSMMGTMTQKACLLL